MFQYTDEGSRWITICPNFWIQPGRLQYMRPAGDSVGAVPRVCYLSSRVPEFFLGARVQE